MTNLSTIKLLLVVLLVSTATCVFSQEAPWRSELYPFHWKRGYKHDGKFVHDFSFAGYHRGETPLPHIEHNILNVTLPPFNADPSGTEDATASIQAAIDSIAQLGNGVVYLPEGTYLVKPVGSGALLISHDSTVLRGDGPGKTFVLNTETNMRSKSIIELSPGNNGWYAPSGASISFTQDAVEQDTIIHLTNAEHFAVGDHIVLTSDFTSDFIAEHQMTGKWNTSMEGVAFARTVKAVDPATSTIEVDIPIRYYMKTRDKARAYRIRQPLTECGIENLSIGNLENTKSGLGDGDFSKSGTAAYDVHASHAIKLRYTENSWVKNVRTFRPDANETDIHLLSNGLQLYQSRLVTVDSCVFQKPQYEGEGGNGYMFILQGNDCLISHTQAIHSRHNFDFKKPYSNGNVIYKSLSKDSRLASDFHMHLSMSNLFDSHTVDNDFLEAVYRPYGTVEHGHSSTQSVFWNTTGEKYHGNSSRIISSGQWGYGYVIGTQGNATKVNLPTDHNTLPKDHLEGEATGAWLHPASLYQDQLNRRLYGLSAVDSTGWDAPVIRLTGPAKNETLPTDNVTITAEIATYAEHVSKVLFYAGDELLGEVTSAPYSFTWADATDGCHMLSVQAVAHSGTVSNRETVGVIVGKGCEASYYGYAFKLPGKVEAEYFNKGKNTLSYFDTDDLNQGGDYRVNEPVDIEKSSDIGGGFNIGWIADGEFLRYMIEVEESGTYDVHFRIASESSGAIDFKLLSQGVSSSVLVPTTGGWQTWETVRYERLELQQGIDTLQLTFSGSFNLNYLELTKSEDPLKTADLKKLQVYPNPVAHYLYIRNLQRGKASELTYTFFNFMGQMLLHGKTDIRGEEMIEIDLSDLQQGGYLLKIGHQDQEDCQLIIKR